MNQPTSRTISKTLCLYGNIYQLFNLQIKSWYGTNIRLNTNEFQFNQKSISIISKFSTMTVGIEMNLAASFAIVWWVCCVWFWIWIPLLSSEINCHLTDALLWKCSNLCVRVWWVLSGWHAKTWLSYKQYQSFSCMIATSIVQQNRKTTHYLAVEQSCAENIYMQNDLTCSDSEFNGSWWKMSITFIVIDHIRTHHAFACQNDVYRRIYICSAAILLYWHEQWKRNDGRWYKRDNNTGW